MIPDYYVVRLTLTISFIVSGLVGISQSNGIIFAPIMVVGLFALIHLLLNWFMKPNRGQSRSTNTQETRTNSNGQLARRTGKTRSIIERTAVYRDVSKQYIATSGTVLALVFTFTKDRELPLVLSFVYLGLSILVGIMLLEILTGGLPKRGAKIVAYLSLGQTWFLMLGVVSLVTYAIYKIE